MAIKTMQKVTASGTWKERMRAAKDKLPPGVGQLAVIREVVKKAPELNRLTNYVRWKNAYSMHVADPELTVLVEEAAKKLSVPKK